MIWTVRWLLGLFGLLGVALLFAQQVAGQTAQLTRLKIDTQSDPQATGYPNSRKLVRDSQGNLYVAYRKKETDGAFHIFVARLPQGEKGWAKPVQVDNLTGFDQRVPSLTIDEADRLHIVWYGLAPPSQGKNDRQIYYAQAPANAKGKLTWTQPLLLAGGVPGYNQLKTEPRLWQEHPVIHVGAPGQLYVVWEGKDAANPVKAQIKVTYSDDSGATWRRWQNLPSEPNSYYSRPTLASTRNGQILYVVAYATRRDQADTHLVWTQSTNQGADWQPWQYVTVQEGSEVCSGAQDQRQVSIVLDQADQLHAVWQQPAAASEPVTQICYARLSQGRWGKPQELAATPHVYQAFPNITVDKDNRLWAVWNEFTQAPVSLGAETPAGRLRAAKQPPNGTWRPIELAGLTQSSQVLYPSLRWHRSSYQYGVDLIWLEREVKAADEEASCFEQSDKEQKRPRCTIYYANLAGQ